MTTRRHVITRIAALPLGSALALPHLAWGQGLDTARILSGFPAGGTVDALARRIADKLRGNYANSILVENRPGAGGQLGVIALKDANPDGSTLLLTPSSMLSIYPFTYPKLQYKIEDVAPVSVGAFINHGLAVGHAVPASVKTLKEFLAWSRANPGIARYGSPGAGSMPHLIGVLLSKFSGTALHHTPYRGTVPGVQDLLGGQISAFCGPIGDFLPHVKTERLRVLVISGTRRSTFLPGVPTLRELGTPLTVREWYGFFLPGKASAGTVRRAAAYLQPALTEPDVVDFGRQFGLEVQSSSADELGESLRKDGEEWRRLIKLVGFTAES